MSKHIAEDVFDPPAPLPEDAPLTPEQEEALARMEAEGAWPEVAAALREHLDDAAETAKPDLARTSERVFARIAADKAQPAETTGFFAAFVGLLARFQPHVALAAATAAIVLAVVPLVKDAPATDPHADPIAQVDPKEPPPVVAAIPAEAPTSVELRRISFENSDGLVFHDPKTDSTVIWVREYDGA